MKEPDGFHVTSDERPRIADLLTEGERKQVEFLEQEWFWNDDAVMALLTILRRIAPAPRAET